MKTHGCWCGHTRFAEALAMFREAMKGQEGGYKRSKQAITDDIVISDRSEVGNSKAYTLPSLATASMQPLAAGWK